MEIWGKEKRGDIFSSYEFSYPVFCSRRFSRLKKEGGVMIGRRATANSRRQQQETTAEEEEE